MDHKFLYNFDHAVQYLIDSIIIVKKKPVYIRQISVDANRGALTLIHSPIQNLDTVNDVKADDPNVNYNPPELGYVNSYRQNQVARFFRFPRRMWKIGLCKSNTVFYTMTSQRSSRYHKLMSLDVANTIMGKYPDFEKARKKLAGTDGKSVAFSRRFALNSNNELFYLMLTKPVGLIQKDTVKLNEDTEYLRQIINKDIAA